MNFAIAVGPEIEKFDELYESCCCPTAQFLITDPEDDSGAWEWMKESIGNAIVSYIKENYYDKNPCEDCPVWKDHHEM